MMKLEARRHRYILQAAIRCGYAVIFCAVLACTRDSGRPGPISDSGQGVPGPAVSRSPVPQKTTGDFPLQILPEVPTVMTDLQIVHGGSGRVAYAWQRNGMVIPDATGSRLSKSNFVKKDVILASVKIDGREGTVSVAIANALPKVLSVPFVSEPVRAGQDLVVAPVGYDADGDEVKFHFTWSVNGIEIADDSPILAADKFKRGDKVLLTVMPYDPDGPGEPFQSRELIIPNAAPRITSVPPKVDVSDTYSYMVTAVDPDGDEVVFDLKTAPTGMTIDSKNGLITWKITKNALDESNEVEIEAKDPEGMKSVQKFTITITKNTGETK